MRKSRINAGTRYYARGLNNAGGPGNESECELLMWTTSLHSRVVRAVTQTATKASNRGFEKRKFQVNLFP